MHISQNSLVFNFLYVEIKKKKYSFTSFRATSKMRVEFEINFKTDGLYDKTTVVLRMMSSELFSVILNTQNYFLD